MARIKIDFPEKSIGQVIIPVRITDINYGNHLGNDAMVTLLHEARVGWLRQLGYTELNVEGASLIMSDLAVNYLNECFYGDVLQFDIAAGPLSSAGFELLYNVLAKRDEQLIPIARAKTGMVFFDYEKRKVTPMPETFRSILEKA